MQKVFCDKCGAEMEFDSVHVEYRDEMSIIGKQYVHRNLCPTHKAEFIMMLNEFIPDFMRVQENNKLKYNREFWK